MICNDGSTRCAHCGGAHHDRLHYDPREAARVATLGERHGLPEAPALRRHARLLALRDRLRATGYAARDVYALNRHARAA